MSNWIRVEDELPEEVLVLVVTDKGTVTVGEYYAKSGLWTLLDPYCIGTVDPFYYPTVTHWMSLPMRPIR